MNGPEQTVVSGTQQAVAHVQDAMTGAGKRVSLLKTYDTPGHSPMLRSMRDAFRRALEPLTLVPARIPIMSTLTGQLATAQVANVEHWLDLVEQPVRFAEALHLAFDGKTTFIEVGPGAALSKLARAKASGDWQCAISSLADGPDGDEESETTGFAHACAHLYGAGHALAWGKLYGNAPRPAELPTYRFDEERFELPFPQRKQSAPAHNVERLRQEIAEIGEAVGNTSVSAHAARSGANASPSPGANSEQLLATIRSIAASVASDAVSLVDDLPLVQLGMDSLALTELRVRLHQTFGKMPPMSMLARGASLVTLCDYFASSQPASTTQPKDVREASAGAFPSEIDERALVVSLREGAGPVIALVHPIGGDVLSYQDLASAWPGDASIVAVRHPYADQDREVGYLSIEQLASLYRGAFVKAVGRVPDLLGGWSFGGLVAHEMAVQWEAQGSDAPPLLIVDSPLYNGAFATRLRNIVGDFDRDEGSRLVDRLLADDRFDALLDSDFSLSDVRRRAHPDVFAHIARLHASSAAAVARHRPGQTRTRISYALATRGKGGASGEQAAAQLRLLTKGEVTVKIFDDDHDSIVRTPSAEGLADFLDGAAAGEDQHLPVTEA